jgi:hypothetical protein
MLCRSGLRLVGNLRQGSWARGQVLQRSIATSGVRLDSFKVQDMDDFKDKVLNSEVPVVVDFFAT